MNVIGVPVDFLDKEEREFLCKNYVEIPFVTKKYIDSKYGIVPKYTYVWYKFDSLNKEELTVIMLKHSERIKIHKNVTLVSSNYYIAKEISDAIFDKAIDGKRTSFSGNPGDCSYNFEFLIKTNDLNEILDYHPEYRNHITIYD